MCILFALAACSDGYESTDPPTTRPDSDACTAETLEDLTFAVIESPQGLAPDVARQITDVTCVDEAAFARVCILCADGNGAWFELLFQRSADGEWELLGIAEATAIDALADDAGITPAELDALRGHR